MYKHSDEEWDIHSDSYHSKDLPIHQDSESVYKDKNYQDNDEPSSDYMKKQEEEEEKKEEDVDNIDARIEESTETKEEESEDYIKSDINEAQIQAEPKTKKSKKKKNLKNIEEAINKAIKEEKEVIILD